MSANGAQHDVQAGLDAEALLDLRMRLSVELGRTRMPVARAVSLGAGAIVDLDREHDDPVEVYVNGLHFGTGRLLLVEGEWALRLETIDAESEIGPAAEPATADVEQASTPGSEAAPAAD